MLLHPCVLRTARLCVFSTVLFLFFSERNFTLCLVQKYTYCYYFSKIVHVNHKYFINAFQEAYDALDDVDVVIEDDELYLYPDKPEGELPMPDLMDTSLKEQEIIWFLNKIRIKIGMD